MKTLKILFITLLFIIHYSLFILPVKATAPVQDVFVDVDSDYKYLDELQVLYDKWMITPDSNWRFNPHALLTRDEFVWILTEVTCKKCISPNTSYELIQQYENEELFYDITNENKYFYCIADANKNEFVTWYHPWTTCEDWTYREAEKPFCPNNNIILEEAIAIILRASWILTNAEAEEIRQRIRDWYITESLSDDVHPKNLDGSVYSFYPDFKKALEYEVLEVDNNWNEEILKLVEIVDWKIRPKQSISKQDFLKIAYVTLKANSCIDSSNINANIALSIDIYNKNCSEWQTNCEKSYLNDRENTYDFSSNVITSCESGVLDPSWYIWRFFNNDTGEELKKYWKYIDNYTFLWNGSWTVYHRVVDKCGNTAEVYNTINTVEVYNNKNTWDNDFKVSIEANPISWSGPLKVDLEAIFSGGNWPYGYSWDYWDWNKGFWYKWQNIYKNDWSYEVVLTITDSDWNIAKASLVINVWDDSNNFRNDLNTDTSLSDNWTSTNNDASWSALNSDQSNWSDSWIIADSDADGIIDSTDLCPLVKGELNNNWCPILEKTCNNNSDCNSNETCNSSWYCSSNDLWLSCEYSWTDAILWNVICNSCPCNLKLDFNTKLRNCDIIFPAITNPDSTEIYNKWNYFQIK